MTRDPAVVADLPDEGEFFLVPVGVIHPGMRHRRTFETHSHAAERVSAGQCHLSFSLLSAWSRLPVGERLP